MVRSGLEVDESLARFIRREKERKRYLQQPVDRDDQEDVVGRKLNRVQHHDHGHQTGLRNSSRADTGGGRRDAATRYTG